jgi:hypothetical protein
MEMKEFEKAQTLVENAISEGIEAEFIVLAVSLMKVNNKLSVQKCLESAFKQATTTPSGNILPKSGSEFFWKIRFSEKWGHLGDFFDKNIKYWLERVLIGSIEFNRDYNRYCRIRGHEKYSSYNINKALEEYCERFEIKFDKNSQERTNNMNRAKKFTTSGN